MSPTILNSASDRVRQYVREIYSEAARRRGETTFAVNVGAVHKAVALSNRVPLVCAALKSKKFLDENGLRLISATGPPSGISTTVTYTYELIENKGKRAGAFEDLESLRGIAKDLFKVLGGGESFIRQERKNFSGR